MPKEQGLNKLEKRLAELERENTLLRARRKYGLVWERGQEDVIESSFDQVPLLERVPELDITADSSLPKNSEVTMIEGDNYDALLNLSFTHKGKIDVICIDPPYNTGNNDFIYNDKFVEADDKFRHSKWLSFMAPRLMLAKDLLSKDGVVFINIGNEEQANLRLLVEMIFGESNLLGVFLWEKTQHFGKQSKNMYTNAEFVLAVAKNAVGFQGSSQSDSKRVLKELLVRDIQTEFEDAPLYNASNNLAQLSFPPGSVKFLIKYSEGRFYPIITL